MIPYEDFIRSKMALAPSPGLPCGEVHPILKPHQQAIVRWCVQGGRRGIFASFGLGKSVMEIEWLRLTLAHAGGRGLIVAPLGVRQEFTRDGRDLLGIDVPFVRRIEECDATGVYITNYETIRDGKLDPTQFRAVSLDEAAVLRAFGGSKTYREFMATIASDDRKAGVQHAGVPYRLVATATPSPNEYIELLAYAAFLGVMDVGQAKTRFFKRDSTKADQLTIHPHKEREFWLWVASWAIVLQKPSDLGYGDEGYALPEMRVIYHEVAVDQTVTTFSKAGQGQMFREATHGVVEASREKRDTLGARVAKLAEIVNAAPDDHWLIWHDLEAERHAIEAALPGVVSVYGTQELEDREQRVIDFSNGLIKRLSSKPVLLGSGCNFQRHCHKAAFVGIGFKFADFIQAIHRLHRFLQPFGVEIHIIHAESERAILRTLQAKWARHNEMVELMGEIIRRYGLSHGDTAKELQRWIGVERVEIRGDGYRIVNNDCVLETAGMPDNSVHLVLTSIPFSSQYEYSPSYNDFGHNEGNREFFEQMDYLTPQLLRVLHPGRICAIHVKDRIVPGGINGMGFQTVYPFHSVCIDHYVRHGFAYMGMKTIVTDVVRENNQTYRLGWTEQCKDGSKMGVGMPEYLLIFRKPPTGNENSYADTPVVKSKDRYSRARWQVDAHGFARSSGNRLPTPEELRELPHEKIFKLFRQHSLERVYDYEYDIRLGEALEAQGKLPTSFMLLQPQSWSPEVWTDITRMLTLNGAQSAKGKESHLCPMQFDLADRAITQWSMPGETVYDPFGGLMTVPYRAVLLGRHGIGCELSPAYFADGAAYCEAAAREASMPSLFDALEAA